MSLLQIVSHPNAILRTVCLPVADFQYVKSIVDQLAETMYASEGIGLAAPQVGILQRFVLIDSSAGHNSQMLKVMINPTIEFESPEKTSEQESCLSLPGVKVSVVRSSVVSVRHQDLDGVESTLLLGGLEARIVQHEIDHLNGITLLQRIKRRKR